MQSLICVNACQWRPWILDPPEENVRSTDMNSTMIVLITSVVSVVACLAVVMLMAYLFNIFFPAGLTLRPFPIRVSDLVTANPRRRRKP
jgi:hypothetical protein